MGYIEKVVVDGEKLLATGRTHWFIYVGVVSENGK